MATSQPYPRVHMQTVDYLVLDQPQMHSLARQRHLLSDTGSETGKELIMSKTRMRLQRENLENLPKQPEVPENQRSN